MKDNSLPPSSNPHNRRRSSTPGESHAHLLGVIVQPKEETDGHKRITCGKEFTLLGGSAEVHEAITEATIKTFEDLRRKGHTLDSANPREVGDLLQKNLPR